MRRALLVSLLIAAACGRAPDAGMAGPQGTSAASGPDAILIRFPRLGGTARAFRWWRDSTIWTSTQRTPAVTEAIAFDDEQGIVVVLDAARVPVRVDLRVGRVTPATAERLRSIASADGYGVFGVAPTGEIVRITNSGSWRFRPPAPVRALMPLPDGALLILSDESGGRVRVRKMRPPETRITDSALVSGADLVIGTTVGDRVYFASGDKLIGLRTRDLGAALSIGFRDAIRAVEPTPSGDRLFVALKDDRTLYVVDRYESKVTEEIRLPDAAPALRMDGDGQYLLARTAGGDSARIVAIGTQRVIGTVETAWRPDLPLVAPDGGLALAIGDALVIVDAETRRERARVAGGAADVWAMVRWNGFRPRAAALDEPVRFVDENVDSTATDSTAAPAPEPATGATETPPPAPRAAEPRPEPRAEPHSGRWMLSFAALLSESRARSMASSLRIEGISPRVTSTERDGATLYRVVAGPFATREAAEEAGRKSGMPFFVFEANP